jgi:hypothetical protein
MDKQIHALSIHLVSLDVDEWRKVYDHSEFPHQLVTVDVDKDGKPLMLEAHGSKTFELAEEYSKGGTNEEIVQRLWDRYGSRK